jgi:hypothetical protein
MSKYKEEEKKRRQLLGEAVCGFVNAETTDEACFAILTGIQRIWGFNPSFIEEVRKVFPAIGNIESPPKDLMEKDDAKQERIACEKKVLSSLREKLAPDVEVKYNSNDHSFDLYKKEPIESHRSLRNLFFRRPPKLHHWKKFSASHPDFLELVEDKSIIDDMLDLEKCWTRGITISLQWSIQNEQGHMRRILDMLFLGKSIIYEHGGDVFAAKKALAQQGYDGMLPFSIYLSIYNELSKSMERRANPIKIELRDGSSGPYPISEEGYLSTKLPKWHDRIRNDLAYCLIEFLRSENIKNLKKCDVCFTFFVHPRREWCSDRCTRIGKRRYDREYKQLVRLEEFVDVVKEKCETMKDFHDNPKLVTRARRFECGLDVVVERLKKDLKEDL